MKKFDEFLKKYLVFICILILWFIVSEIGIWSSFILPPPEKVLQTTLKLIRNGELIEHVIISLRRVFTGFLISSIIGIPLGVLFGMNNKLYVYFKGFFNFLRNVPPLAMIPMLILWFGIGELTKVIVIILATFFPIFTSTMKGIRNCDSKLIEVGKAFELSKFEVIYRIIIPSALLDIAVGLKLALGYAFRGIIGAELIASSSGLGYLIQDGKDMSRTDVVLVGIIVIGILGIFCDFLFGLLVKKVSRGKTVEAYE